MVDSLSPERRSALMARVRQRNTKPEMVVRRLLHARGWRYRLHKKGLPGTPDIVFPGRQAVLFVHGCFWHGHNCKLCRLPKTRTEFWAAKLSANRERDARKVRELGEAGWRVMTIWQCSLKDPQGVLDATEVFLRGQERVQETRSIEDEQGI